MGWKDRARKVEDRGIERALARDRKLRKRAARDMVVRGRSLKDTVLPRIARRARDNTPTS